MENFLLWITNMGADNLFSYQKNYDRIVATHSICAYSSVVERVTDNDEVLGSIPSTRTK